MTKEEEALKLIEDYVFNIFNERFVKDDEKDTAVRYLKLHLTPDQYEYFQEVISREVDKIKLDLDEDN